MATAVRLLFAVFDALDWCSSSSEASFHLCLESEAAARGLFCQRPAYLWLLGYHAADKKQTISTETFQSEKPLFLVTVFKNTTAGEEAPALVPSPSLPPSLPWVPPFMSLERLFFLGRFSANIVAFLAIAVTSVYECRALF